MRLFLGLPVDSACQIALSGADSQLLESFVHEDYLCDLQHEGGRFLGKWVPQETSLAELELIEANLMSLLHKILPKHPLSVDQVVLFSYPTPYKSKC